MIEQFIKQLKIHLDQELPGPEAQSLMMPRESNPERFKLDMKNARLSGVLVLFYQKDNSIYFPLTQRHDYGGTHGGQVSLPGGKYEKSDVDVMMTAVRETHEEIGIPTNDIEIVGKLTDLYIPPSNFRVTPFLGFIKKKPNFILDPVEVKELVETPIARLVEDDVVKTKNILVRNTYRLNAPYFDIEGKVVWGATAMILSELVSIIKNIKD